MKINPTVGAAIIGACATLVGIVVTYKVQMKTIEAGQQKVAKCEEQRRAQVEHYRRIVEAAPQTFVKDLDDLIQQAAAHPESEKASPDPLTHARAIVSARDGLRSDLDAVGQRLDSDIDALKIELSKPRPDPAKLRQILEVLRLKWPAKKSEVDLAVRKIETELGFVVDLGE